MRSLFPPVKTNASKSATVMDRREIRSVGVVELARRAALQQVTDEVGLDRPVHHRLLVGRVTGVLGILATGVEVEVDEPEQMADLVGDDGDLDAGRTDKRRRGGVDAVDEDRREVAAERGAQNARVAAQRAVYEQQRDPGAASDR